MEHLRSFFKTIIVCLFLSTANSYGMDFLNFIFSPAFQRIAPMLYKKMAPLTHTRVQPDVFPAGLNQELCDLIKNLKERDSFHFQTMTSGVAKKGPLCVLLHGEPGTGKTHAARALAGQLHAYYLEKSGSSFLTMWQGSGFESVKKLFEEARSLIETTDQGIDVVICIDEIDRILKKRDQAGLNDSGRTDATTELLTELTNPKNVGILFVGTTNMLEELDDAALRTGRLGDCIIKVNPPDEIQRLNLLRRFIENAENKILQTIGDRKKSSLEDSVKDNLATATDGFVVSDLEQTVRQAFEKLAKDETTNSRTITEQYSIASRKIRNISTLLTFLGSMHLLWKISGDSFVNLCQQSGIDTFLRVLGGEKPTPEFLRATERGPRTQATKNIYILLRLVIMFVGWKLAWPWIKKIINYKKIIVPQSLQTQPTEQIFMNIINAIKRQKAALKGNSTTQVTAV